LTFFIFRDEFHNYLKLYEHLGTLCSDLLSQKDITDTRRKENFNLVFFYVSDPCSDCWEAWETTCVLTTFDVYLLWLWDTKSLILCSSVPVCSKWWNGLVGQSEGCSDALGFLHEAKENTVCLTTPSRNILQKGLGQFYPIIYRKQSCDLLTVTLPLNLLGLCFPTLFILEA
jgi:hypothetical protein